MSFQLKSTLANQYLRHLQAMNASCYKKQWLTEMSFGHAGRLLLLFGFLLQIHIKILGVIRWGSEIPILYCEPSAWSRSSWLITVIWMNVVKTKTRKQQALNASNETASHFSSLSRLFSSGPFYRLLCTRKKTIAMAVTTLKQNGMLIFNHFTAHLHEL